MLSGYINKVRAEEKNVIYAIAGDMFRGSVIDSDYQGLSTIEIMNMLAPDVAAIGNHEIDYGVAHLLFIEKCARFPIVNANLYIKINGAHLFTPFYIKEIDGMRILFIGIITEEIISQAKSQSIIGSVVDINDAAKTVGRICDAYNATDIDFTVLLTHIGFEEDKKLAALLDPAWGVDVIIGGHSHTFLTEPWEVNGIPIVQAGTGTDQIGRFDLVIDTETNALESYTWRPISISSENCPPDREIEQLIARFKAKTDAKYNRIITRFSRELIHPNRWEETELGDVLADAMRDSLNLDVFLLGSGSIRNEKLGPIVTLQSLMECFPYDDQIYMVKVNGAVFKKMLRHIFRDSVWRGEHSEFYQFSSGLRLVYSIPHGEFKEISFQGRSIADNDVLSLGIQDFHFKNCEEFLNVSEAELSVYSKPRVISTTCRGVIEEYLGCHQHLGQPVDGRVILIRE